ncbi:hypothetical protein H5410_036305, partial [Solanum commersonii]
SPASYRRPPLLFSSLLAPSHLFSPARTARQIAASLSSLQSMKVHCSVSPSTASASELQAINISSRRGEQQHLRTFRARQLRKLNI